MLTFVNQFKKYIISQLEEYDFSHTKGSLLWLQASSNDWPGGNREYPAGIKLEQTAGKSRYYISIGAGYWPATYHTKTHDIQEVVDIIRNYNFGEKWCQNTLQSGYMNNYGKKKVQSIHSI